MDSSGEKKVIEFSLPYPPSVNHYYDRSKDGKVFLKKKVKEYREFVLWSLKNKILYSFGKKLVRMEIHIYHPDRRERDLDNTLKCIFDTIQLLGVYERDSQIKMFLVMFKGIIKNGRVDIIMQELGLIEQFKMATQSVFNKICSWCSHD